MELKDYPLAIANLAYKILRLEQSIISLTEGVKVCEGEIDKTIAFNQTLKNDAQRKAKKLEMQQTDSDYYQASRQLKEAKEKRENLAIELEMLRNYFSILKLEKRHKIAELEQTAAI